MILFVVGLGGVMQIRSNAADDTYTNARREDLIQILDGLGAESRRLENEIAELEQTRTELQHRRGPQRVAREEAERRIDELSILAGTAPATGPGIRMRISDPDGKVTPSVLLDAVEEMRDAGAEVIEVNDEVRVVASTWFGTDGTDLIIDGSAGQPADHHRGDRRPPQPGGGGPVPRRAGQRDHRSAHRRRRCRSSGSTSSWSTSLHSPRGESVRSASVCRAHPAVIDDRSTRPVPRHSRSAPCRTIPKT